MYLLNHLLAFLKFHTFFGKVILSLDSTPCLSNIKSLIKNINESLNTTVYDLNKLYHFYFYFENPYIANTVPIFGNSMITNDTIPTDGDQGNKAASYGEVICTPFAGKVVEINLAFEGDSDHTYWESDIIGPVLGNTQDNFLISTMNPGLVETVTKTNQYLRSNIQFKFGDNCTFEKGDMLLAKLEIDGVGSSFNDGDCIGHTFIKYDTSS